MSMLTRISRIDALLRKAYVNIHNRRLLTRFVRSPLWMLSGIARTAFGGLWNAESLSRPMASSDVGPVLFRARAGDVSLRRFMLRLAEIPVESLPPQSTVDVILVLSEGCQPAPFATLARHLPCRLNLHLAWAEADAKQLVRTLAHVGETVELESDERPAIPGPEMIGRLRPRQIYANAAREYFKSIDWSTRYCAISASSDASAAIIFEALTEIDAISLGWRFVFLGAEPPSDWKRNLGAISVPSHSGLDFAAQMALAMEADAYFGDLNTFAIGALLAGRAATILRDPNAPSAIEMAALPSVKLLPPAATAETFRAELGLLLQPPDL
jgi:hypothetical protein